MPGINTSFEFTVTIRPKHGILLPQLKVHGETTVSSINSDRVRCVAFSSRSPRPTGAAGYSSDDDALGQGSFSRQCTFGISATADGPARLAESQRALGFSHHPA